ncbi:MAG: hypothetical protein RhofKO_30530 [Rhodothermales bacterium]
MNPIKRVSRLKNKVALVTGAARGIGEAIARAFIAEGARVLLTDIRDALGTDVAQSLGDQAAYRRLDVREEEDWQAAIQAVTERRGALDIVVNNAGITGFEDGFVAHDPEHASLDDWRAVHRTNLDGVFLGCKYAIQAMRPQGTGAISTSPRARASWAFLRLRRMRRARRPFATTRRAWRSTARGKV